uniref:Auxin-responsive protein n=1 Tax=Mesocestoides corti TaxID=53468 RepID=A0A5K3FWS1_MESCO
MGPAASSRRDRKPHNIVCRLSFTGLLKSSECASSRNDRKRVKFDVAHTRETKPHKVSSLEKGIYPAFYDNFSEYSRDYGGLEEIIGSIICSNDSELDHDRRNSVTTASSSKSLFERCSQWAP